MFQRDIEEGPTKERRSQRGGRKAGGYEVTDVRGVGCGGKNLHRHMLL